MNTRPTISLIVITRNEEELIGQCLTSAKSFCNELIVVDSLSTDRTVEIARSLGARVFEQEFTNYVRQKQIALDHAVSEWVLLLDADEQATYELGREIESALSALLLPTVTASSVSSIIFATTTPGQFTVIAQCDYFAASAPTSAVSIPTTR